MPGKQSILRLAQKRQLRHAQSRWLQDIVTQLVFVSGKPLSHRPVQHPVPWGGSACVGRWRCALAPSGCAHGFLTAM